MHGPPPAAGGTDKGISQRPARDQRHYRRRRQHRQLLSAARPDSRDHGSGQYGGQPTDHQHGQVREYRQRQPRAVQPGAGVQDEHQGEQQCEPQDRQSTRQGDSGHPDDVEQRQQRRGAEPEEAATQRVPQPWGGRYRLDRRRPGCPPERRHLRMTRRGDE